MREEIVICLSLLSLCFVLVLIKILEKLWLKPNRLQSSMRSQGMKGPSYKFIHGSITEIKTFNKQAMSSKPLSPLSNDICPFVQPHIHAWTNLYGKNYLQWYGPKAQVVITEPELIKGILNDRHKVYLKPDLQPATKKIFGDGVAMSQGQKWEKIRKIANHAFQLGSLKDMVPAMISSAEAMLERFKDYEGKEIDVYEQFKLFSSEVISRTAFGSTYSEGKIIFEKLEKLAQMAMRTAYSPRIPGISPFFKTRKEVESERLEQGIRESILEIIRKREANQTEDSFGNDFLGVLVKALHNADKGQRISMDEIVDECKTFYFAGQDTTSSLLAWTVFLLAVHTDWQEEARKEVISLFGEENPNPDEISKLKSMSMIINESLRLYPPAAGMARRIEMGVRLGSLDLPPNTALTISILAVHHDRDIWGDDAQLFKPERFSEGVAKAAKNNNNSVAFFPFGMGPRTCVGFNFAILEAKIALAMILQRYNFTLSPTHVHSPVSVVILRPKHGVRIMLRSLGTCC